MRGGAERYHVATLDNTIQQHMIFEQATKEKQKSTPKSGRKKKQEKLERCGGGRFGYRGGRSGGRYQNRNNGSHLYNNNNYESHYQQGGKGCGGGGHFGQRGGQDGGQRRGHGGYKEKHFDPN